MSFKLELTLHKNEDDAWIFMLGDVTQCENPTVDERDKLIKAPEKKVIDKVTSGADYKQFPRSRVQRKWDRVWIDDNTLKIINYFDTAELLVQYWNDKKTSITYYSPEWKAFDEADKEITLG